MPDYLVESIDHKSFDLVPLPRIDGRYGLVDAVTSDRLPVLLEETGLTGSLVAKYAAQLALRGAVDSDLLRVEGQTIVSEFTTLSERMRMVELDWDDPSGYAMRAEVPEDDDIYCALRGYVSPALIDRDGYVSQGLLNPFELCVSASAQGESFIRPFAIEKHLTDIVRAVHAVAGEDNPLVTHGMEQHVLRRNQQGKPISISDDTYLTVGHLNEQRAFVPYATLLQPFHALDVM